MTTLALYFLAFAEHIQNSKRCNLNCRLGTIEASNPFSMNLKVIHIELVQNFKNNLFRQRTSILFQT